MILSLLKRAPRFPFRLLPAVLLMWGLASCSSEESTPLVSEELERMDADNVLFGMVHYMTTDGVREAQVTADTAYFWNDSSTVALRNLRLTVFTETGLEKATVTGIQGTLDTRTDRMVAQGDVVLVVRDGGQRIETAELYYDPPRNRIWSDSATVMTEGTRVTTGSGFESDVEFRNVRIRDARVRGGRISF